MRLPFCSSTTWVKFACAEWVAEMKVFSFSIAPACAVSGKADSINIANIYFIVFFSIEDLPLTTLCSSILSLRCDHFAIAVALHSRDDTCGLHLLDQSRGTVVADAQIALHQRDRRPAGFDHDFHRLVI